MKQPSPRWAFLGMSTNVHDVTFASFSYSDDAPHDEDLDEFLEVFANRFGAKEVGRRFELYSVHIDLSVSGMQVGLTVDDPGFLDLCVRDPRNRTALVSLAWRLLSELNGREDGPAAG